MKKGDLVKVYEGDTTTIWRIVRLDPDFASQVEEIRVVEQKRTGPRGDRPTCPVSKQAHYTSRGAG
jgi:hypothetical protein